MQSLLFYLLGSLLFSNTLSVKDYGATGNGTTDDTQAIQSCLSAAQSAKKNVFFPAGTYLCNHQQSNGVLLNIDISGTSNLAIYGDGATILTTKDTADCQLEILASSRAYGFVIADLSFKNTHGKITGQTNAIYIQGGAGNNIDTSIIQNNAFDGFSNAIVEQGITYQTIKYNVFAAAKGHDCAQNNSDPGVYIWFADNSNGLCKNVYVQNNQVSGYTGSLPVSGTRPMDGFVYGYAYGEYILDNSLKMFSQEGIYVQPPSTNPSATDTVLIAGNTIDCTITPGWVDSSGAQQNFNYGIRVDAGHAGIVRNHVINYTTGIILRPYDFSSYVPGNSLVAFNVLSQGQDSTLYATGNAVGVVVAAQTAHPYTNLTITNNNIYGVDANPISLSNCTSPVTTSNLWAKPILQ